MGHTEFNAATTIAVTCPQLNLVSFDILSCFYQRPLSWRDNFTREKAQFATMVHTSNSHCGEYEFNFSVIATHDNEGQALFVNDFSETWDLPFWTHTSFCNNVV